MHRASTFRKTNSCTNTNAAVNTRWAGSCVARQVTTDEATDKVGGDLLRAHTDKSRSRQSLIQRPLTSDASDAFLTICHSL